MFRGLITSLLFTAVCILMSTSCSVQDEVAIEFSPDTFLLEDTKWTVSGCPANATLFIDGYSECDYLKNMDFRNGMVYIKSNGSNVEVKHHICFMDGSTLSVSIQDCSSPTWSALFKWNIVSLDNTSMVVEMEVPNIMPSYHEEFTFSRVL